MDIQTARDIVNPKYTLESLLASEKFQRNLGAVLNKDGQAERFVQIALNTLGRQPELKMCSQASFFDALLKLSQINLDPDGYYAHLVPFWNKKKDPPEREIQLIIDYKGLVSVIRRSPSISVVKGLVIREKDQFEYEEGSSRVFKHKPNYSPAAKDAKVVAAYSFIKFANIDDWEVDVLPIWRIEEVRERSRAKDSGPWITDFAEMAIKTALRHHSKTLPLRSEDRTAVTIDDDQYEFDPWSTQKALPQTTPTFDEREKIDLRKTDVSNAGTAAEKGAGDRTDEPKRRPGRSRTRTEEKQTQGQQPTSEESSVVQQDKPAPASAADAGQGDPVETKSEPKPVVQTAPTERSGNRVLERADAGSVSELLRKINLAKVTQVDVIQVLQDNDIAGIERAVASGLVSDLRETEVQLALKQWETVIFNIAKRRKAEAIPKDDDSTFP